MADSKKTKKQTMTKRKGTKKPTRKQIAKKKAFLRGEVAAISVVAIGIFLFLSVIGSLGTVGAAAGGLIKGIFGVMAYVFPFFLLYLAWFCITKRNDALFGIKIVGICVLFLAVCGFLQLLFGTKEPAELKEIYRNASDGFFLHEGSGGLFGAMLSQGIGSVFGRLGAYLILIVLILIALVTVTEKSIVALTRKGIEKTAEAARSEGQRARVRISEERVRLDARREAKELRKKEERLMRTVSEETEQNLRRPASLSSFDLRQHKNPEEPVSNTETEGRTVSLGEKSPFESPAVNEESGNAPVPETKEPDYDLDEVPFTETEEDRYKSYRKMLADGSIGIREAEAMGYAVSRDYLTVSEPADSLYSPDPTGDFRTEPPERCAEKAASEEEFLDDDYEDGASEDHLPKALDPSEIIYPEIPEPEEETVIPSYEAVTENETVTEIREKEPEDPEEEPDPEFIENEFRRKHIEERTPIHVSMGASYEEETGFGADKYIPPVKTEKSTEDAQKELEQRREAQKQTEKKIPPRPYRFPPIDLLARGKKPSSGASEEIHRNSLKLEEVLRSFGVGVKVTNVVVGPRVTRYELAPDIGVKLSRITSLAGDIKLALAARELRIEAPIPGKSAVGIEIPNRESAMVTFRDIMETDLFRNSKPKLTWGIGLDIQGQPVIGDISKMPHLLVSGTTGSGKSVGINSIIMSVIYREKPSDVKMILVDPKVVELSVYDGIPHLLAPVVTKPEQAINVLKQAVAEMNQRYRLFKESNTRNIKGYNEKVEEACKTLPADAEKPAKMPYILIIIDELAELMMHSKKDVEESIASLTQLARAAGIHLVVATQRPSVDVVTGLIKSNIPSRVAMRLPSLIDSRTILDTGGAETLLGNGDMLYKTGDMGSPIRIQGCYLSDEEVQNVVEWLKKNNSSGYSDEWETAMNAVPAPKGDAGGAGYDSAPKADDGLDEYFYDAGLLITEKKKASIGSLQRKFKIGFNRAARIMEQLNENGVVSEGEGTKERQILMTVEEFRERFE